MYKNLETLLVTAANGKDYEDCFKLVSHFMILTDLNQD